MGSGNYYVQVNKAPVSADNTHGGELNVSRPVGEVRRNRQYCRLPCLPQRKGKGK